MLAYLLAVATGIVTGLVAGKPIWAKDARIEAGLKAAAGAVVGAGLMYALRTWGGVSVDLGAYGNGVLGELPMTALPMVATVLALFYEIDNSGEEPDAKSEVEKTGKTRVAEALPDAARVDDLYEDEPAEERVRRTK